MAELTMYTWGAAPGNLKTRRQLAELGLRPGGPAVGRIVWQHGRWEEFARLYDVAQAVPKKPATPAQLAALAKAQETQERARETRRHCPYCGYNLGFVPGQHFSQYADCPGCGAQRAAADRAAARQQARAALANPLTVILDTETTDLDGYVVQIAVLGVDGAVLFESLVNPLAEIAPEAQAIHGLTSELLAAAPVFAAIEAQLHDILTGRPVWAYNADFDARTLARDVARVTPQPVDRYTWTPWTHALDWHCAMEVFAQWYGEWSAYHGNYRWQPLPGGDHTALGDCRATLAVLRQMAAPDTNTDRGKLSEEKR